MKKSILFLLVSSILSILPAVACGPGPNYAPNGLQIFRVIDPKECKLPDKSKLNVASWQRLIGVSCSYDHVYSVVYKSSLEDIQSMRQHHSVPRSLRGNAFAQVLCHRDDLLDFLITAKLCEQARGQMNDPWYYPSHHCPHVAALEQVVDSARAHQGDSLLYDRYALQQMRAQISLGRHADNVTLWETYASQLPEDNVMRQHMVDYAIGAYERTAQPSLAKQLRDQSTGYYNNPLLLAQIQDQLKHTDDDGDYQYDWQIERRERVFTDCRKTAIQAISHPATTRMAEWYYMLAYIDDVLGQNTSSEQFLRKAEKAGGEPFIRESVHLFRIYRDAKMLPVNDAYERKMLTHLQWLERRLERDVYQLKWEDDMVCIEWLIVHNYSRYYWNDMLRRIGISVCASRLMKAGRTMRALEVINYAENKIFILKHSDWMHDNHFGYLFQALDTRPASVTMQWIAYLQNSHDEMSQFLAQGSYIDYDWLYNIAGTLSIRESKFSQAVKLLSHLPSSYKGDRIDDDPFAITFDRQSYVRKTTTRRAFAAQMVRLEQTMRSARDINDRADAQIRYATALRNIYTVVWQATAYGFGNPWFMDSYTPDTQYEYAREAIDRSDRLMSEALHMYTDDERAAAAQLRMLNFQTVVTHYAHTAAAEYVRSHCENYHDFCQHDSRHAAAASSWYDHF